MAARDGMITVITRLRSMTDAGTADYSIAGTNYWQDDQLQDVLDGHRADIRREALVLQSDAVSAGSVEYHDYYWRYPNVEAVASGTAAWVVEDSTGADVGTASYEINDRARHIRFTADTEGSAYYLSYRAFDLERAAAEVWEQKAAHVSARYDLKIDNHDMKRSQLREAYLANAREYRRKARPHTSRLFHADYNG